MIQTSITGISPFFIVRHVPTALSFYSKMLGFEVVYQEPNHEPFFAIVQRDGAMILVKDVGVERSPTAGATRRRDGMLMPRYPILMRWRPNLRRAVSPFPNRCRTLTTVCAASKSKTLTATSCFLAVLVGPMDSTRWCQCDRSSKWIHQPQSGESGESREAGCYKEVKGIPVIIYSAVCASRINLTRCPNWALSWLIDPRLAISVTVLASFDGGSLSVR